MVTKDLQTLNLKFNQVMFNGLILTWERNFEVTFGIFSVSVFQISVLESYLEYNIQVLTIEMTGRKPLCIRVQITAVTLAFYFMPVLCVLYSKTLKR